MKKLLFAVFLLFVPSLAFAQCNGVFQPNTYCGNNTGSARPPFQVSGSTNITGPGSSTVGDLATWTNTLGTSLGDTAPGALTGVNDTNVTITFGGTPASALVKATSITLGWQSTLSATRGGTGLASGTSGGLLYFSSGTAIASSGAISGLVFGNGAGAAPTVYAGTSCTNQFPRSLSAAGVATCNSVSLTGDVVNILPIANGGTNASTASAASTNILPTTTRAGDVIYWNGSNWTNLSGNNSGTQFLQENASGVPSWATVAGTGTVTDIASGPGITNNTNSDITTTGTLSVLFFPQGRLTLQSATPVMTTTQANKGTLFYDCYNGGRVVPYYNGTTDLTDTISGCEVSDAMVSAASAGQVVNGNVYDVWWVHGGANRICIAMSASTGGGGGWSSDTGGSNTARGTGYSQLDTTTRPYITNKNAITNCFNAATNYGSVSANQGTYLGTIYATANGQSSYQFGSAGTSGQNALFGVFNAYNPQSVATQINDTTASWTYNSGTYRQANNSTSNQAQYVDGIGNISISAHYGIDISTGSSATASLNIGIDSVAAGSGRTGFVNSSSTVDGFSSYRGIPGQGLHTIAPIEKGNGNVSTSWFGSTSHFMQFDVFVSGM